MKGFWGRLLHVDLTTGRHAYRDLPEARLRHYLGGVGLGTSLLHEYAPAGVDPYSPANPLIFATAPLVGTPLTTTAKFAVVTKSPLTGFIADSLSSSHFALELKRLGIDALVLTGRAPSFAHLVIEDDDVQLRDAGHLRGRSAQETQALLGSAAPGRCAWVAAIGAAGEHRVRYATISNEGRHAGRGGAGAVMGAKNLKAIAISGSRDTTIARPHEAEGIADALRRRSVGTLTDKYRSVGTVANVTVFNRLGTLPARNFQQSTFDEAEALAGEALNETHFSRRHGCASCSIRCERLFTSRSGAEQRLEYETLFALGPLCGVSDPDVVLEAARWCDHYGIDAISAGGTIAWAIECSEKELLPEARAFGLRFGEADGLLRAIEAIGRRAGIGDLLAEGSRRAAEITGGGSSDWAMHVKGLELPGYEPRSLKTMALGLAVSPRGACHNRSGAYEADFSGDVDRFHGDASRGAIVARSEDFNAVLDSLIVCKFLRRCFTDFYADAASILGAVTGWDCTAGELRRTGERIHTLKKLFNVREQWQRADDWLPARLLRDTLPDGVAAGAGLSPTELREMIRGYYEARGWDEDGFVPLAKQRALDIDPVEASAEGSPERAALQDLPGRQ